MRTIMVTEKEKVRLYEWERRFRIADRCKTLAWYLFSRSTNKISEKTLDRRMDFLWVKVKEIEPFATFDSNLELTGRASYFLAIIRIQKVNEKNELIVTK